MSSSETSFIIVGKPIPYRPEFEPVQLGEIHCDWPTLRVVLTLAEGGPFACECEVWEHTVYELELLSSTLHRAAVEIFPPEVKVDRPESQIGTTLTLRTASTIEVGYSIQDPAAGRSHFTCYSREWGKPRDRTLGVAIALSVGGRIGEVVVEPALARELAVWLDGKIAELYDEK